MLELKEHRREACSEAGFPVSQHAPSQHPDSVWPEWNKALIHITGSTCIYTSSWQNGCCEKGLQHNWIMWTNLSNFCIFVFVVMRHKDLLFIIFVDVSKSYEKIWFYIPFELISQKSINTLQCACINFYLFIGTAADEFKYYPQKWKWLSTWFKHT